MKYLITYSAVDDPDKKRGCWKTEIEAETEDKATELFERFFPQAFLKTIEPASEQTND